MIFSRIMKWFKSLFPGKQPKAIPSRRRAKKTAEHFGAHYYLGDLLDRLDMAFDDFPAFKRADPEAFSMYRKLGASVTSSDALFVGGNVEPQFQVNGLPSFSCLFFASKDGDEEKIAASFAYFMKVKRAINVQPSNGVQYRIGFVYKLDKTKHSVAAVFYVSVSPDGKATPLKVCKPRHFQPGFSRMEWAIPVELVDIADEAGVSVDEKANELFTIIANASTMSESGLTVRAKKDSNTATFAIDILRTPYFFSDRDKTVTESGQTKKILHLVRGHYRTMAGGERKFIKSHFRGLRKFHWRGYDVSIGLNGKHHVALSSFQAPGFSDQLDGGELIETSDAAEILSRHMEA